MFNFNIAGLQELQKSLDRLGKTPQKHVTAAAKKAMNIALKDARANAPVDTGNLKRGIILVAEKSRVKSKKVYRIVFSRAMNNIFQKKSKTGKTSYYPISQEYGYNIAIKNKYGYFKKSGKFVPGQMFVHGALNNNASLIEKTITKTMKTKIDAEIARGSLR